MSVESASSAIVWHAYCSSLRARLISTLDTLDTVKYDHSQQIEHFQRRMHALHAKYRVLKQRLRSAESERDDLRENVDRLIQKVEQANDYRVLPHSTIHLSSPLDPLKSPFPAPHTVQDVCTLDSSQSTLIPMLVRELAWYKGNYIQLKHSSDAQIALLEAQLARRDFELESYQPCICSVVAPSHAHGSQPKQSPPFQFRAQTTPTSTTNTVTPSLSILPSPNASLPFSSTKAFGDTAHRQRILQTEVALLRQKLDNETRFLSQTLPNPVSDKQPPPELDPDPAADLQTERDNIACFVSPTHDKDDDQLKECLLLEEECIRLRKSKQELRQKLLLASTTEQVLRDSITNLQRQLHMPSTAVTVNDDDDEGNISVVVPRISHIQTELKQVQAEADRRQLVIDELRAQIASSLQNIKDIG